MRIIIDNILISTTLLCVPLITMISKNVRHIPLSYCTKNKLIYLKQPQNTLKTTIYVGNYLIVEIKKCVNEFNVLINGDFKQEIIEI